MRNKRWIASAAALFLGAASLIPAVPAFAADITETRAKSIALKDAGVSENDVVASRVKLDYDDGKKVYEVEFYTKDYKEYDYEIDPASGSVLSVDYDAEEYQRKAGQSSSEKTVSLETAKASVLKKAGVKADDAFFTKSETDRDDGRLTYEFEFIVSGNEYEAEVNANTGEILEWSVEAWD